MEQVVESVLRSMSSVQRPQAKFIASLFSVLMVFQGKANFRNMSRYSVMHEKRFSRWYPLDQAICRPIEIDGREHQSANAKTRAAGLLPDAVIGLPGL